MLERGGSFPGVPDLPRLLLPRLLLLLLRRRSDFSRPTAAGAPSSSSFSFSAPVFFDDGRRPVEDAGWDKYPFMIGFLTVAGGWVKIYKNLIFFS